ncbi:hypothetical protein ACIQYQ_23090 [Pseudomonas asiatica]|uniref:hypothetical protein n=1 Tax=Pseudomonas TaxID=286 RepID=UPI00111C4ADB|nr:MULTISPECIES: hypothetical protein [Pseudomonas]WPX89485.1 hypothetical protein PsasTeo6_29800 [Pseudomonas asiatica]
MSNQFGITLMTLEFDKDCNMESEFFGGSGSKGGCGGSGGCGGGGGCNGGSGGHNNIDLDTLKQKGR